MAVILGAILFTAAFILSFRQEPRRFQNVILFFASCGFLSFSVNWLYGNGWFYTFVLSYFFLLFGVAVLLFSLVLLATGLSSLKKEKFTTETVSLLAGSIMIWFVPIVFYAVTSGIPYFTSLSIGILHLPVFLVFYAAFAFLAFVLYTALSHQLPRQRRWDYILIFGAPLLAGGKVPRRLLRRMEMGLRVYQRSGGRARFLLAGGEETRYMRSYLESRAKDSVLFLEENACPRGSIRQRLAAAQECIDQKRQYYRCLFITSDYRVFRVNHYARKMGIRAEGVGCRIAAGIWPRVMLREYFLLVRMYWWTLLPVVFLWAAVMVISFGW